MVLKLVAQGLAAVVTGSAVHDTLGPVGFLPLGQMAFSTAGYGGLYREGSLPVLAQVNLGIENFHCLAGNIRGNAAAAFAARLAGGFNLVGVTPFGDGNMAQHRAGSIAGQTALDAAGLVAGIVDGKLGDLIPAEQLIDHRRAFLAAPEQGIGGRRAVQGTADGAPVGNTALIGFKHGIGKLIVGGTEFLAHQANDAVKHTVATGVSLVPVAVIGHHFTFGGIKFVRLPAKLAVNLRKTPGRGVGCHSRHGRRSEPSHCAANSQATETTQQITSATIHCALLVQSRTIDSF